MRRSRHIPLRQLRKLLRRGYLRPYLQLAGHESWGAEDLVVRQVELAGRRRRPICAVKIFTLTSGMAIAGRALEAEIRRLIRETSSDYTLVDALPVCVDFPIGNNARNAERFERFFALILIGPQIDVLKRGENGAGP